MKVYLNDPIAPSARKRLEKHVQVVNYFDQPEEMDAVIVRQQYCTADVNRRMKKCRLIQQHGVGLDRIDVKAAEECGIPVKNTPGSNARSVAEYTIGMMLDLSRKITWVDKKTRAGELTRFGMPETVGIQMSGKKLGVVGSGHIAQEVSQIAKDGFRMEIFCFNPFETKEKIESLGMHAVSDLKDLFRICDYVSLHCLLTEDTVHMISGEVLENANPGLILVNTARGKLIDEKALYDALITKKIAGAGLDVFEEEPPSGDNPLLKLDNFLAGMHVAGSTLEAMEFTGNKVVDNVFNALSIQE